MSMPRIPDELYRPSKDEVVIDLLKSIAMEETAIAHILNAEAEKIRAFVGTEMNFPGAASGQDIARFNRQICKIIDVLVMKEWLLLRKLEDVIELGGGEFGFECEFESEE